VSEPYRMFTSRAEYRLSLRADNADQRLTPLGVQLGCISGARQAQFDGKMARLDAGRQILRKFVFTPQQLRAAGHKVSADGTRRDALTLLGLPGFDLKALAELAPEIADIDPTSGAQIAREMVYDAYLGRQEAQIKSLQADENRRFPPDFDFKALSGLSRELAEKLSKARPETMAQAARVDGITPAALVLLLSKLQISQRRASA